MRGVKRQNSSNRKLILRTVIQRVISAQVQVDSEVVGQIEKGYLALVGVEEGDSDKDVKYTVDKMVGLRVFEDDEGKMNLSIKEVGGAILAVSQFTLLGDVRKGRRPSFIRAASPEQGNQRYEEVVQGLRSQSLHVETGIFQADMKVQLVNDGPVTILLDSRKLF